jgi:predicted DCC family thiol-disulfide oxidoreductase YuxK
MQPLPSQRGTETVGLRKRPVLVYDGDCAFCTKCAGALERIGPEAEIVAWQLTDLAELGITEEQASEAVQWVETDDTVRSGHEAIASALSSAGRIWQPIGRALLLPGVSWVAAKAYRLVARNRYRLPGGTPACAVADEDHDRPAAQPEP